MALMPRAWVSQTPRREEVVGAVMDLVRDLVPFVQTGIKAADELRDRAMRALRQRAGGLFRS
ncbi:hypothetical protein ACFQH9_07180 [Pseudonocardia lutea]|uniref:Uncharacterized protein n=1 Tax=Pseudonocardia lutea TaxID=2172015 RepID=A0ABW1I5R7_9PSEU